eukprot:2298236-Pleurochrysis_carterae.AAC.4
MASYSADQSTRLIGKHTYRIAQTGRPAPGGWRLGCPLSFAASRKRSPRPWRGCAVARGWPRVSERM